MSNTNPIKQKGLDMLEKIKEQLGSTDEELVKQAITLLLDLGLEEETEKEFGSFLAHSDGEPLIASDELISLLRNDDSSEDGSWDDDSSEDDLCINFNLIETCLLALLGTSYIHTQYQLTKVRETATVHYTLSFHQQKDRVIDHVVFALPYSIAQTIDLSGLQLSDPQVPCALYLQSLLLRVLSPTKLPSNSLPT